MLWSFLRCLLVTMTVPALVVALESHPPSAGGAAAAPGAKPEHSEPAPSTRPSPAVIRVYRESCLQCHDADGKGEIARDVLPKIPDFADAAWQAKRSDADLGHSILEGKGKSMPSMRAKLGSVDVVQMVSFVRGFRGGNQVVEEEEAPAESRPSADPPTAAEPGPRPAEASRPAPMDPGLAEGRRTFQRSCAACHGGDGRGADARGNFPEIPDFTAADWQRARTDPHLVVSVLDGRGTGMPAFRDKLSREQARGLVAFIRSLGPSPRRAGPTPSDDFEARFRQLLAEFEDLRAKSRALSAEGGAAPPPQPRRDEPQSGGGRGNGDG
jgi:mono/diheme cytochrome c family protein